jgi:hypothetical protein
MTLTELIKGKSIDELNIIIDSGEEITVAESYDLVVAADEYEKQTGTPNKSYICSVFLYLLVDKMKKEGISEETKQIFLSTKDNYNTLVNARFEEKYRPAQQKIIEQLALLKTSTELKKIQEVVSDYASFLGALPENYATQYGENIDSLKKGYSLSGREGEVAHDFRHIIGNLFEPMRATFDFVDVKTDYAKPAKDLYKQWGLM